MRSFERGTVRRSMIGVVAGLALVAAGCGSDADTSSGSVAGTEGSTVAPATTGAAGPTESTGSAPSSSDDASDAGLQRIVSLSPTHTEIMFAIGAGDQVVAVDDQSELSGRGARTAARPVRLRAERRGHRRLRARPRADRW